MARAITDLVTSTPIEVVLAKSQLPQISARCQTIYLLRADEWAHIPPADCRRQTHFTDCRLHLKRKDWRISLNHVGLNPHVLSPTPLYCEQLSQKSLLQLTRECHHPSRNTLRFKPLPQCPKRTSISSHVDLFEMESWMAVPVW